jgi:hypothetical protein
MNQPLLPALIALAFAALAGGARADAQRPETAVTATPAPVTTMAVAPASTPTGSAVATAGRSHLGPTIVPPTGVTVGTAEAAEPTRDAALILQRARRMQTSRLLMIGGTALAIGGLFIGGDAGAIVSVTGGSAAVFGLYLHYR